MAQVAIIYLLTKVIKIFLMIITLNIFAMAYILFK